MQSRDVKAPKYIPADVMRKLTKEQLIVIASQRNTRGKYSNNALAAQKILFYENGRTHFNTGTIYPLTQNDKGWRIPITETIDIEPFLNGSEVAE